MSGEQPAWEYRLIEAGDEVTLETLGAQGWEVVATGSGITPSGAGFVLKRPRLGFRERVTLDQKRHVYASRGVALPEERR